MIIMKKLLSSFILTLVAALSFAAPVLEGPFLILSTPYHEDGSVCFENLVKEARFAAEWDVPGVIWPQSNDAIDLLTKEERFAGMRVLVEEWKKYPKSTVLTIGVSGDDTEDMLIYAEEAERLAEVYDVDIALCARPPYYATGLNEHKEYFDALAKVAKRPVIIQTYVNDVSPVMPVDFLVSLAREYPETYGWIKEESNNLEANDRQREELAAQPDIKTVFSAWGGWQWLYQRRQIGTCGLISERIAYSPIVSCIWKMMKDNDRKGHLTEAYALYRLLIDQRFLSYDSLRGYSLYYFVRLGLFDNTVSRVYASEPDAGKGTYSRKVKPRWKLNEIRLSEAQKKELDKCYDDMMIFVNKHSR